jgi:hypothetical protein
VSNVVAGGWEGLYHLPYPMNGSTTTTGGWQPQTEQDRDGILHELQAIIASQHFCNSKRYPALLKYIVENTLEGKSELLKERTLGVDVFDRPPDYDTNTDTVVRFTASEVRKRLHLYYSERRGTSGIQISLPLGSYVPEFLLESAASEETKDGVAASDAGGWVEDSSNPDPGTEEISSRPPARAWRISRPLVWLALIATIALAVLAAFSWVNRPARAQTATDDFWRPILREKGRVLICAGGNVLAQNGLLGVITAGKDIDYPYFSITTVSSVSMLSRLIERGGSTPQFAFAATTPLPQLHERPTILLNAYNNHWTLRLAEPLRFHFTPEFGEPNHSIVDRMHPDVSWKRDSTVPYASADDYALVARYWDTTTDNWVLVLAGIGRNGTEAAAQVVTSPQYLQLLKDQAETDFSNRNIEAVVKVSVIEGKTGAPIILAVHVW